MGPGVSLRRAGMRMRATCPELACGERPPPFGPLRRSWAAGPATRRARSRHRRTMVDSWLDPPAPEPERSTSPPRSVGAPALSRSCSGRGMQRGRNKAQRRGARAAVSNPERRAACSINRRAAGRPCRRAAQSAPHTAACRAARITPQSSFAARVRCREATVGETKLNTHQDAQALPDVPDCRWTCGETCSCSS